MTSSRPRVLIAVAVLLLIGVRLLPGGSERLELSGQGIDTFVRTLPAGVPFSFDEVVVANHGDESMTLREATLLAPSPGLRVLDVRGVGGTRLAPGERARIGFSLEIPPGGPHTFQAVRVSYEQGGELYTQPMAYKLVACAESASTCEIPSEWED